MVISTPRMCMQAHSTAVLQWAVLQLRSSKVPSVVPGVTHLPHVSTELYVMAVQYVNVVQTQALQAGLNTGPHPLSTVIRRLPCTWYTRECMSHIDDATSEHCCDLLGT
jgi:hypothetical protein